MNFEKLWEELEEKYPRFIKAREDADIIKDIVDEINKPPTEQEVCEALSEFLEEPVWFDKNKNIRVFTSWVVEQLRGAGLEFMWVLPPHLITLIGRFYEGLEAEE